MRHATPSTSSSGESESPGRKRSFAIESRGCAWFERSDNATPPGDTPAIAQAERIRDADVGEKHRVEVRATAHLADRPDFDARRASA